MTDVDDGWQEAVGITFDEANRMYVWDRPGRVWIVENNLRSATPLIDISEEVSAWNDLGCLGFALDPKFRLNGYIYLYYVVDHHHLQYFGTPQYNPAANDYFRATIGRLTRYTAIASSDFRTVDPASRKILLGETISTGIPITYNTHSVGSLVFGTDGTLLASCGDGGALSDEGSNPTSYYLQALNESIIKPKENVGAFRCQMVDSLSGKILRLNPANGDGVPSNPFYDPANPRAARSRVWAMGFRNPFRMTPKPGTGSHVEADANPGVLFIGDVGYQTWEEITMITGPGQNAGWPVFEGFEQFPPGYEDFNPQNPDAPNPLFGIGGCTQQYFRFRDLLKEATLGTPSWPNPCNTSQQVPASIPHFVHTRPLIDWRHGSGPSRCGTFIGDNAAIANIGDPGAPVSGPQFGGNCAIGGVLYNADQFPASYKNTYFFADYVEGWIKNMEFDSNNAPVRVNDFAAIREATVAMVVHPVTGELYLANLGTGVQKISYGGNAAPKAIATSDVQYGPGPLTVQFNGSASSDPEGQALTYRWNFGDGSALSTQANPAHTFNAPAGVPTRYDVTLTVTDSAGASNTVTLIISVNNTPPAVTITSPADGALYPLTGDAVYPLNADVTDNEHSLAQLSPAWQVVLHHNTHTHPNPVDTNWTSTAVTSPLGCGADTYYYRITLTVTDPAGLSTTREAYLYPDCSTNTPPSISDIPNQAVNGGQSTAAIPFTVGDVQTPADSLTLSKASSNPTLVPLANIAFGGSGSNRTVTVTPAAGQTGTATITVSVSDGVYTTSDTFVLSVFPANNTAPTISSIANQVIDEDTGAGPINFTISDSESAPDNLSLSRGSSNPTLAPTNNITFGGSGANRTVTLTPAANQNGTATITVTVSDGQFTASTNFLLTVTPVNDAPTLNPLSDIAITTNSGQQTVALSGIGPGAANEANQTLTVTASSSNPALIPNPAVNYTSPASTGSLAFSPVPNASGSATITVTVDDGQSQNSSVVRSFSVTVGGPPIIYIEAESATIVSPMVVATAASAYNNQYVHSPASDQGTASFQLNIPSPGTYLVWCRVIGSNHLSDSFFVSMDGGAESIYDAALAGWSPDWQWNQLNARDGSNPRLFTLTQGTHTLLFRGRDPQTRLDAMYITTDLTFVPPVNPANTPPVISDIPNQSVNMNTATAAIGFTVGDAETAAASLVVSGASSNPTLVPNANIVFGGSGSNRTVTVTPATGQSGTATITVTVSDGAANASDTFLLTVNPLNNTPPTISAIADQTTNEDTSTAPISITVGDAESAPGNLTLSAGSSNPTLAPTSNIAFGGSGANRTVTVTPAANQNGTATITVNVSDGQFTASTNFLLTVTPVNDAPTLNPLSDITISTNSGQQTVALSGIGPGAANEANQTLTVTATSSNPALIPNPAVNYTSPASSGSIAFSPAPNASGSATITVTVDDGQSQNSSIVRSFSVTVGGPPIIYIEAESGTIVSPMAVATAASAYNNQYVYSTDNNQGTASYQVNISLAGTYVVWCRVIGSNHLSDSFFVTIDGAAEAIYDAALAGWSPTWQWNQVNARGGGNPRLFTLTQGSHTLAFRSRDRETRLDAMYITTDLTFVPPVNPANTPPMISDIPNQTVNVNTATAAIGFTVGDAETAAASLVVSGTSSNPALVPNANIVFGGSGSNRTVTVTPATGQSGAATITVTVTDGAASASDTFLLTVNPPNNTPPTISAIPDQTTNEDTSTGSISFTVGDAESAPGSLTLSAGSSNPTLVPTSNITFGGSGADRTVTITPAANQNGTSTITVSVSDGQFTASTNFVLTVNAVNDAPTISNIADQTIGIGGTTGPLNFTIADVDTPVANLSLSSASSNTTLVPPGNIVIAGSGASRSVSVTAAAGQTGTATISVTVTDGVASATDTFVVTVTSTVTLTFSNAALVDIPPVGDATPYPSVINVSNLGGTISELAINLNGFAHTWPNDVDVLLVGPTGQKIVVMSDVGGGTPVTGVNFVLTDSAVGALPAAGPLVSGTFKPTDLETGDTFPAPAPAGPSATILSAFNGTSPNGAWSLYVVDDGNGDQGDFAGGWSVTITTIGAVQQTPQVTWPSPASITYGTPLSAAQLNATADVPGSFAYSPGVGTVLNAGSGQTLSVTFTPTDTVNYRAVTVTRTIDVQRAALQITAADKSRAYGNANPPLTATYSGFVNGEGPGNLTTPVSLSTAATAASPVGTYTITASGATSPNYTITHVNGTLSVAQAPLTITADDKVRAFSEPNPPLTASYAGFVNGDTPASLDTPVILSTPATAGSPIGTYPITASGATAANYAITHVNGTLTITPQNPPNVTLSTNILRYIEGSGPVLLDPLATLTDSDSSDFDGGNVTAEFTVGGADEDRLALRSQGTGPGQIDVSGADVSYEGVPIGVVSGGEDGATPLVVALNANASPSAAQAVLRSVTYENVSSTPSTLQRTIQVSASDGDGGTSIPRAMTVAVTGVPEDPIITWAAPAPITYGTGLGAAQLSASASVPGTFVYTPAAGAVLNASNGQTLRVTFTPDDGINYRTVTRTVSIDVLKAALTITAANKIKVYGSANPSLTANYSGFVNGDSASSLTTPVSLSTTATAASPVGGYTITASGATAANYTITHVNGTLSVTTAPLTITADNKTRAVGQPNPPLTASYAGFVNGDTAASLTSPVSLTTSATTGSPAGSYPIVASGATAANYLITHVNGTLTVTPPGGALSVTNSATITIPHVGTATPYPSVINVSGLGGTVTQVIVRLNGFGQTWPNDVDVLMVGPTGQKVMLMSDVGGGTPVTGVNLTLSDGAAANLPAAGPLVSGTFRPTDLEPGDAFPAPVPAGAYATTLAAFNGLDPNGVWSLYVIDDGPGDLGSFAGGWSLTITAAGAAVLGPPTISDIADQTTAVNVPTTAIPFTVGDPDTALTSLIVSGSSGNQTLVPNANLVFGGSGANRTVTVTPATDQSGTATITVSVSDGANSASDTFVLTVSSVVSGTQSFTNAASITIPDAAAAIPYPSTINVSGLGGTITDVVATLNGFEHAFPADADVLLVGPGGQHVMLMSDAGGGISVSNVDLTFSALAATSIPQDALASGTYKPTDYDVGDSFPAPAPEGPYGTNLSVFNGLSANGTWSLYAVDDGLGDPGSIAGGWSLTITTVAAAPASITNIQHPTISISRMDLDGSSVLTVIAPPGHACQIESSQDLLIWKTLATVQSETGVSSFTDEGARNRSHSFYRVVTQP